MKKVYACLLGNWVCLNDDPECKIGENLLTPSKWWEENAPIYAPIHPDVRYENSFYGQNYISIVYQNQLYRINPIFIQISNK